MFDKMKQMYELKKQADQMKKELESEVLEVDHGGIKVKINGAQKILNLDFEDGVDHDKLKDAINKASDEAQKVAAKKMQGMMGGMSGLQDLLKG
ncbi:MAG TPA: YbaB/EbfC family nucleoid-associated protein [Candidatus Saccharimonadales bacterium]|nr:YbaB/EbfC family nucleoid-associated protein [Candidatus Saccharimonadales bacterium]